MLFLQFVESKKKLKISFLFTIFCFCVEFSFKNSQNFFFKYLLILITIAKSSFHIGLTAAHIATTVNVLIHFLVSSVNICQNSCSKYVLKSTFSTFITTMPHTHSYRLAKNPAFRTFILSNKFHTYYSCLLYSSNMIYSLQKIPRKEFRVSSQTNFLVRVWSFTNDSFHFRSINSFCSSLLLLFLFRFYQLCNRLSHMIHNKHNLFCDAMAVPFNRYHYVP